MRNPYEYERTLYDALRQKGAIEIVRPKRESKNLIKTRLFFVYDFIRDHIRQVKQLLDFGTYDGFGLPTLLQAANHVTTVDMNPKYIEKARKRLRHEGINADKVKFIQSRIQEASIKNNYYDVVTIVELFGDGFRGQKKEVDDILKKAYKALKSGGTLILTLPSRSFDRRHAGDAKFADKPGKQSIYRDDVSPSLKKYFGEKNIDWYGQDWTLIIGGHPYDTSVTITRAPGSHGPHTGKGTVLYDSNRYIIRQQQQFFGDVFETPAHWIGVCHKPK